MYRDRVMRYTVLLVGHCYSEVLCSSIRNKRFVGLPTEAYRPQDLRSSTELSRFY